MSNNKVVWIINHYAGSPVNGLHLRHYYLGQELIRRGFDVFIISSSYTHLLTKFPKPGKDEINGIRYIWIKSPKYNGNGLSRLINTFYFAVLLFIKFKNFLIPSPNIIYASSPHPFYGPVSYKIAKKFSATFFYEVRDIWPLTFYELSGKSKMNPVLYVMKLFENFTCQKANYIISPLPNFKSFLRKNKIIKKVFYIPNGINFDEIARIKKLSLNDYEITSQGKFFVGYMGSISKSNSVLYLILAAVILRKNKRIYFLIIGDGEEAEKCKKIAKMNNLNNVIFLGKLPRLDALGLIKNCNVLFNGSPKTHLYEYGISAVKIPEYMALGIPILDASDPHNNPVLKYGCGINVEQENSKAISQGILQLYSMDNQEIKKIKTNCLNTAKNHFSYNAIGGYLASIFKSVSS